MKTGYLPIYCGLVLFLLSALTLAPNTTVAQVYKTVDEGGRVTFTDSPEPAAEAEAVKVQQPNTAKPIEAREPIQAKAKPAASSGYKSLLITDPANDGIISNGLAGFSVSTSIKAQITGWPSTATNYRWLRP